MTWKITVKTLKGDKFPIEVNPSSTVKDVKVKISEAKGWEVACQKIIHAGKILQDENTLEASKMKDGSMLVCMVSKPKRTAAAAATTSTTTTAASTSPTPAPVPAPSSTAMDTSDSTSGDTSNAGGGSSETPAAASNPAPPTTPFSGPDFDAKVSQLKDMG